MIDKDEYWSKELKAYDSTDRMSKQKLAPCPFCKSEAELIVIGNEYTKKRGCEIKCKGCFVKRRQMVLRQSIDWIVEKQIMWWNNRGGV